MNLRWHWQWAACFAYSIVVILIVTAAVSSQGRPSQSFYLACSWVWPIGFIGSWILGRPSRGFLLSGLMFLFASLVVFGAALGAGSMFWISSKAYLLNHADATPWVLVAIVIGIINLVYRAIWKPQPATKQPSKSLKRGLTPLLVAQFMGAANDNILKTLLSFAVVSGIWAGQLGEGGQGLIALCLFIPFILFSGWAGPIADRHSKKTIALWMKVVELPLALAAGIGFATSNLWLTILAMVLLATQSAFFSPAKYGMIPEIVKAGHVTRANGILNMATNIAVITGMLIAGFVSDSISNSQSGMNLWIPGFALLSVAIVGVIAISFLPTLKPLSPSTEIVINPMRTYFETAKWAWGSPVVTGAIAWSVFYFIATLALLVVTELGVILNVSHTEVSYILATLAIAVGCGSLVAGFISKNKIRVDISRLAAIFMGVILCMAGLLPPTYIWMMICMFGLGFTAGLYAIPLQSMMQILPEPNHRGRVLASCNALSFLFMGIASLLYWITRPLFGDHPQWIFVACGFTAFFAWYLCRKIPNILVKPTL